MEGKIEPNLTEPGIVYYLHNSLRNHHIKKMRVQNRYYNLACFLVLLGILGIFLFYKIKSKPEVEEQKQLKEQTRQYLLNKFTKKTNLGTTAQITNLPKFESDFELLHNNYYNV